MPSSSVGTARGWQDAPAELKRAHEQLRCLYEISKCLSRFDTIDHTIPEVLGLVGESVPLATAVLLLEEHDPGRRPRTRAISWYTNEAGESRVREAKAHANATYVSLARRPPGIEDEAGSARLPSSSPPPLGVNHRSFLHLPLVVPKGTIFGALQIGSSAKLSEPDLKLVNAVVGQVSIALDRASVIETKRAADQAALLSAEFLAKASGTLFSSLDYQATVSQVARAAVPFLADICLVDEIREDGNVARIASAVAHPGLQELADRLHGPALLAGRGSPDLTRWQKTARLALMSVGLDGRGRVLGVLTFLSTQPDRRYSVKDWALAEEIGHRVAIAIDNSRLFEQAKRASKFRDDLLAAVSHDLRSPLGAIALSASMLRKTALPDDPRTKAIENIQRSVKRMSRLIGDLLDVASIEAGHMGVDLRPCPVLGLIDEAVDAHRTAATAKGLVLEHHVQGELHEVDCDRERILEVLDNLLGNAIKFTAQGGSIRVDAQPLREHVLFSVVDTGPGLRADEQSKVFDRFWQAKKSARKGTGLGLPIAKGLVEAHGGKLWVESKVGAGSTFFFTLRRSRDVAR